MTNTSGNPIKAEQLHEPLHTLPETIRDDYPLVKYWYRHEWTNAENSQVAMIGAPGKTRASHGENVTLRFVEDENGNIIDGFRATAIRKFSREIWSGLGNIGKAPKTWGKVDAKVANEYRTEMGQKFPELQLCEGSWKADLIATLNYPSWYNNHFEKESMKRTSVEPLPTAKRSKLTPAPQARPQVLGHRKKPAKPTGTESVVLVSKFLQLLYHFIITSSRTLLSTRLTILHHGTMLPLWSRLHCQW
jgi:hypothetical protein